MINNSVGNKRADISKDISNFHAAVDARFRWLINSGHGFLVVRHRAELVKSTLIGFTVRQVYELYAGRRNSRKRRTKLLETSVARDQPEKFRVIVNEKSRDRNNFRITKQRSAPVDRDPRRGTASRQKTIEYACMHASRFPLRTCRRMCTSACCRVELLGQPIEARVHTRPCRGVCPPRMATKLRQKKKRSGTEREETRDEGMERVHDVEEERTKRRRETISKKNEKEERKRGIEKVPRRERKGHEEGAMRMHSSSDTHRSIIR